MSTPAKHARRTDDGFTIIEVIVAMVILGILIAMVAKPLLEGIGSVNHQSAATSAHTIVVQVTEQMRQDLENARAEMRTIQTLRSSNSLEQALVAPRNTARNEDPAAPPGMDKIDVYDIIDATPTRLAFSAEVAGTHAGFECVQWDVVKSGPEFSVVRTVTATVTPGGGCGGATLIKREIVRPQPYVTSEGDNLVPAFSYRVECNKAQAVSWAGVAGCTNNCNLTTVGTPGEPLANAVVSVSVDISDSEARAGQGARSTRAVEIPLPSRNTQIYRRALGCA